MCSQDQRLPVITEIKRSSQDDEAVSAIGIHRKHKNKTTAVVPYDNNQEADDSRCGSSSSSQRSAEVSDVSGQQSAETLSTLLFYFSLLFLVINTIVFIIILVVGGARQEENTRFTWQYLDALLSNPKWTWITVSEKFLPSFLFK